ncbi:MAG TPA: hypothetical protein VHY08_16070, partial [Bacillota bacterium]|nr:hypothetical protein [Bacillota bacterium]
MERLLNHLLVKKILFKSGIVIILGYILFFYLSGAVNADWGTYFPINDPLLLPATPPDTEIPRLELFTGEQDQLYALNFKSGQLVAFNPQGSIERLINLPIPAETLKNDGSMWVQGNRIYLKPAADNLVWIFDLQGALQQKVKLDDATDNYYSFLEIVVDPRGYIYLMDGRAPQIKIYNPEGGYEGVFLKKGLRSNNLPDLPESFCLDNEGNFYFTIRIADTGWSRIIKYSYSGRLLTTFTENPASHRYRAIWVDSFQNLYAMAPEESLVVKFDPRGQKICQFQAECLAGLTVDRRGTVFLASPQGNLINRFLPSRVVALIDRGNRFLKDSRLDLAESCFKKALILDNQLEYIHSILGEVYFRQRRFREAMIEFQQLRDPWRYSQSLI